MSFMRSCSRDNYMLHVAIQCHRGNSKRTNQGGNAFATTNKPSMSLEHRSSLLSRRLEFSDRGMSSPSFTVLPSLSDEELLLSRLIQIQRSWVRLSPQRMKALAATLGATEEKIVEALRKINSSSEEDAENKSGGIKDLQTGVLEDNISKVLNTQPRSTEDRAVGILTGVMIGDCLGAPVEGYPRVMIKEVFTNGTVDVFVPCTHMGVRNLGYRYGMYTDDSNSTLALATSLVSKKAINPADCGLEYAKWWQHTPTRGCPDSASSVFKALLGGLHYSKSGRTRFLDGSFANGGAMKISPLGVACRHADSKSLRCAVKYAIMSTHAHPQAVDGAACIAAAIGYAMGCTKLEDFNPTKMISRALEVTETKEMRERLETIHKRLKKIGAVKQVGKTLSELEDLQVLKELGGLDFQIKAIHAVPHVLWIAARYGMNPVDCMTNMISVGGDTDTTASMVGGIMGALHGTGWIPIRWWDNLENGEFGRDSAISLALSLAKLDIKDYKAPSDE